MNCPLLLFLLVSQSQESVLLEQGATLMLGATRGVALLGLAVGLLAHGF